MESIAVLSVSAQEWNETKSMISNINKMLHTLTNIPEKELLSPKEVCKELNFGRSTFERLKNNGILKITKLPNVKKIFVERVEMERYRRENSEN